MKPFIFLLITIAALSAHSAVTNITVEVKTEIAGVSTNKTTLKFQQDGSAKDALTIAALAEYYAYVNTSGLYTNSWDEWLKDTAKAAFQSHNAEKSAKDLGAAVDKVANAAKTDTSLLSTAQKNQILAIAASLP